MGLLRKGPKPLVPLDAPLDEHLDAVLRGKDDAPVQRLVHALAARPLWLALRELPPGGQPGQMWTSGGEELQMASSTLPDGTGSALLVFSSQEQVLGRHPEAFPGAMPGRRVLDLVVADYDGLVLDPAGRWQALAAAWIRDALAVEPAP